MGQGGAKGIGEGVLEIGANSWRSPGRRKRWASQEVVPSDRGGTLSNLVVQVGNVQSCPPL